jgi:hypothetical protein
VTTRNIDAFFTGEVRILDESCSVIFAPLTLFARARKRSTGTGWNYHPPWRRAIVGERNDPRRQIDPARRIVRSYRYADLPGAESARHGDAAGGTRTHTSRRTMAFEAIV